METFPRTRTRKTWIEETWGRIEIIYLETWMLTQLCRGLCFGRKKKNSKTWKKSWFGVLFKNQCTKNLSNLIATVISFAFVCRNQCILFDHIRSSPVSMCIYLYTHTHIYIWLFVCLDAAFVKVKMPMQHNNEIFHFINS